MSFLRKQESRKKNNWIPTFVGMGRKGRDYALSSPPHPDPLPPRERVKTGFLLTQE
jgi:hypothetical protein